MALFFIIKAMSKYRFKKPEEFKADGNWIEHNFEYSGPENWNDEGQMEKYHGQDIPDKFNTVIERGISFDIDNWTFQAEDCIIAELSEEEQTEILEQIKNSLKPKKEMGKSVNTEKEAVKRNPVAEKFVFMDKTINILNVGFMTGKNVVLFGPGE